VIIKKKTARMGQSTNYNGYAANIVHKIPESKTQSQGLKFQLTYSNIYRSFVKKFHGFQIFSSQRLEV
jgi:hypothetical protein